MKAKRKITEYSIRNHLRVAKSENSSLNWSSRLESTWGSMVSLNLDWSYSSSLLTTEFQNVPELPEVTREDGWTGCFESVKECYYLYLLDWILQRFDLRNSEVVPDLFLLMSTAFALLASSEKVIHIRY